MIIGEKFTRTKHQEADDLNHQVGAHRPKVNRHQKEREKHDALKTKMVAYLSAETPMNKKLLEHVQDDFALTVTQVAGLEPIYAMLNELQQEDFRKIVKLNLRTKKEKEHWHQLSDADKAFVSLFMSEDQHKRYDTLRP